MVSPVSTFKQMFELMKRETRYHPEVHQFLSDASERPKDEWIDLGTDYYVEKLRLLRKMDNPGDDDLEAA